MKIARPDDPLDGASDDLRAYLATLPALPWWTHVTMLQGRNPYSSPSKKRSARRLIVRDYDSPEGRDVAVPDRQAAFQSIMLNLRQEGWEIQDAYYLLHRFSIPGARWLWDQPGDGQFLFHRSWQQAENYTPSRAKKEKYEVYDYIVGHVWAYIRRNPGRGTREMRDDWANLLPSLRGVKRAGAIAAARQRLLDDNLIEIVHEGRKAAAFCTVDVNTGEIIDHPETSAELDRLVPVKPNSRRVPFRRLTLVNQVRENPDESIGLGALESGAMTKTYEVRTYGCQMNVHDSERLSGLLETAGYEKSGDETPDLVVFNTCAVRENADNKLYGNLGHVASIKAENPGMQIAVGGCLAQKDRDTITKRAPYVDVVFGTHNIGSLPVLLERARVEQEAQVEILESLEVFPSTLPTKRDSVFAAWVSISVGCNNTCTFCIVPALRGKEKDRRPGDILAEIEALVADGVVEVTLLGQNVNAYGVEFGDRQAFAKLLRACGEIEGLERVRFTSPHPKDFTDDVIAAMAETPNVMPQLHMPLQSGSDRVLKAMRRSYRSEKFLGIIDRVREAMPDAAITTDIIVGFPGETEEDFAATLDVVRRSAFTSAFTFQYSKRPGTPAAELPDQLPKSVVQERYERLIEVVDEVGTAQAQLQLGRVVELLVADHEGKKDGATRRMTGRARDNRLVHFVPGEHPVRPGDMVTVRVTHAAPHHLVSDDEPITYRRTAAGDAWETRQGRTEVGTPGSTSLGMPSVGAPAPLPPAPACAL